MDFASITRTDYSKVESFIRDNYYRYTKAAESDNYILWRVDRDVPEWKNSWDKYELWKKKFLRNPDGTTIVRKLSDEDGGKYYWFFNNLDDFKWYLKTHPDKFPEEVLQICPQ